MMDHNTSGSINRRQLRADPIVSNREWIPRRSRTTIGVAIMQVLILWCQGQAGQQQPGNMFRQVQAVLDDGPPLLNVSFDWQLIIKGGVIVLAVLLDKIRTHGRVP